MATTARDVQEYIKSVYSEGLRPRDAAKRNAERAKGLAAESKARFEAAD
jgi:hypothetical protein